MKTSSLSLMQIGELAKRANVSHRTIHYYERLGLIRPAEREGAGYRYYDETAFRRLNKINALKQLGLSLEDISAILDLFFADSATEIQGKQKLIEILRGYLHKTDVQISALTTFRKNIAAHIERIEKYIATKKEDPPPC